MKPSPGPWKWADDGARDVNGEAVALADGEYVYGHNLSVDGPLIALAPEMREMLLASEWVGTSGDRQLDICPTCHRSRMYGHAKPYCRRADLLEKLR